MVFRMTHKNKQFHVQPHLSSLIPLLALQLALLTHSKLLDLLPPEKRSSELLAAVQTVATALRSIDEIEGTNCAAATYWAPQVGAHVFQ